MLIRFGLLVMIVLIVVTIDALPLLGSLTETQCKSYFASNNIHLKLQAVIVCPKKWWPKPKRVESSIAKRSIEDEVDIDEELDDFYLFW